MVAPSLILLTLVAVAPVARPLDVGWNKYVDRFSGWRDGKPGVFGVGGEESVTARLLSMRGTFVGPTLVSTATLSDGLCTQLLLRRERAFDWTIEPMATADYGINGDGWGGATYPDGSFFQAARDTFFDDCDSPFLSGVEYWITDRDLDGAWRERLLPVPGTWNPPLHGTSLGDDALLLVWSWFDEADVIFRAGLDREWTATGLLELPFLPHPSSRAQELTPAPALGQWLLAVSPDDAADTLLLVRIGLDEVVLEDWWSAESGGPLLEYGGKVALAVDGVGQVWGATQLEAASPGPVLTGPVLLLGPAEAQELPEETAYFSALRLEAWGDGQLLLMALDLATFHTVNWVRLDGEWWTYRTQDLPRSLTGLPGAVDMSPADDVVFATLDRRSNFDPPEWYPFTLYELDPTRLEP